ncbi:PREDICTED: uncharacterized protein LOC104608287 [Nelumbo nucifera]|uniref:Uncharacterized protein LOC104608287 n=2 Tax=Nelumbo nucifera TaxID=4432 RepID=A0A1U8AWI3_NELNU|nr:PREDICTED: uncharacterized protein LOC104608287 [Nelumbo nucifera]DAD24341.1 TPA_asm: hypothetical protein HUJ06_025805 [Nelumbo nucifera]
MCCCCGGKMCRLCTCLILVVILIGLIFGFGVFKHGFQKLKNTLHDDYIYPGSVGVGRTNGAVFSPSGRPFLGYGAPPVPL